MPAATDKIETPYGTFFSIKHDVIGRQLKDFGAHQLNDIAMIRSFLRFGDRVIDVGAHIGTIAIPLARTLGDDGQVYAFEASPANYALLRRNVTENRLHERITTYETIVADRFSEYVVGEIPDNSGATFLCRGAGHAAAENAHLRLDDWWLRISQSLPDGSGIDFIKVDVEGMELDVLASARRILDLYRPGLFVEVIPHHLERAGSSAAELDIFLRRCGYHFFINLGLKNSVHETFRTGRLLRLWQGGASFDVLAVHKSSNRYPKSYRSAALTALSLFLSHLS